MAEKSLRELLPGPSAPADGGSVRAPRRRRSRETGSRRNTVSTPGRGPALLAIVLALVLCAGLFWWGYRVFSARIGAVERMDAATALIESADGTVVQADSVIREKVTPELADAARSALMRVSDAQEELRRATRLLDEARPGASKSDLRRIELLERAAQARLDMLEQAPVILQLNVSASEAQPMSRDAWGNVLAADRYSDKAVVSYNKLTKKGVQAARSYNKQAAQQLTLARTKFAAADKSFSEAPLEQFLAYVDARIKLNELSQQSDAAWLGGDVKKANSIAKTYNREDKEAVALAKALPASPDQAIADAYEAVAKAPTDAYYAARDRATKADANLRAP